MASGISNDNKRNNGIDLLRIVSMLYVVILHSLGHGGVLETVNAGGIRYQVAWFIEIWAYCAVDVFALISGYISVENKRISRQFENYIVLWCQVVVYSILAVLFCELFFPGRVSKQDLITAVFPLTCNNYWYFTAYTGGICLMPFISLSISKLTDSQAKKMLIILIVVFSCFDVVIKRLIPSNGYTFVWLLILFAIGRIIKKCRIGHSWKSSHLVFAIVFLNVSTWIWKMHAVDVSTILVSFDNNLLVSYCSPTVLISSMLYLILFSKITAQSQNLWDLGFRT